MFKQINQVKLILYNSCISFDANIEKDYFKPTEQLLSLGNNLISSEYTNEEDIQEEINPVNYFNVNFNLSNREGGISSNSYFIEDKLAKEVQKKETTKLGKKTISKPCKNSFKAPCRYAPNIDKDTRYM